MESPSLKQNIYPFLHKPIKIGEQQWGDNTVPLVSISCITYNHESYISKAIEGFLLQETTFQVEILIHDDASLDKTADVVRIYEAKYPQLIKSVYEKENQYSKSGFAFSHLELARAKGKYIAICEGDDYWTDPLKLEKQVEFLEKNNQYSLVCHDAVKINEITNTSTLFFGPTKKKQVCSTKDALNTHFCPTASIVFRKQALLPLSNLSFVADVGDQGLVQLISLKGLLYRMYDAMSVYRKTATGASEANRKDLEGSLNKRINALKSLNKISRYKYQRYILLENLLIKNRIYLLRSKSKVKTTVLKLCRKTLSIVKNII